MEDVEEGGSRWRNVELVWERYAGTGMGDVQEGG